MVYVFSDAGTEAGSEAVLYPFTVLPVVQVAVALFEEDGLFGHILHKLLIKCKRLTDDHSLLKNKHRPIKRSDFIQFCQNGNLTDLFLNLRKQPLLTVQKKRHKQGSGGVFPAISSSSFLQIDSNNKK